MNRSTGWAAAGVAAAVLISGMAALNQASHQAEDSRRRAAAREALAGIDWWEGPADYLGGMWDGMSPPVRASECRDPAGSTLMGMAGLTIGTGPGETDVVTAADVRDYLAGVCD